MWLGPDHRARSTFTYTWPGSIGNDTRALTMLRSAAGRSCPAHGPAVWAATIEPPACDTPCNRSQPGNNRRAQGVLKAHVDKLSLALRQAATLGGIKDAGIKMTPPWPAPILVPPRVVRGGLMSTASGNLTRCLSDLCRRRTTGQGSRRQRFPRCDPGQDFFRWFPGNNPRQSFQEVMI
jgi:hypothetical protein